MCLMVANAALIYSKVVIGPSPSILLRRNKTLGVHGLPATLSYPPPLPLVVSVYPAVARPFIAVLGNRGRWRQQRVGSVFKSTLLPWCKNDITSVWSIRTGMHITLEYVEVMYKVAHSYCTVQCFQLTFTVYLLECMLCRMCGHR